MAYTAHFLGHRRLLPLFLVLLGLLGQLSPIALANSQSSEQVLTTRYFKIFYPAGEEKTATWYASFADDVDASVTDLLGAQPVGNLTLRIYASEADYTAANPAAEYHPGILAHVNLLTNEIGVAVERLRQAPPELARESFRHEMTHIVAGELSSQNLPIGFQEGFAQYDELSSSRGHDVAQTLQAAQDSGTQLLSLRNLNNDDLFRRNLDIAYPQSYAVMAFLADRFGMAPFARFLSNLKINLPYDTALQIAYNISIEELDRQWRDYLPQFLKDGWKTNVLQANDLNTGIALYDAGRYSEAKEQFARSERLYTDLGRSIKAQEAATRHDQAEQAEKASNMATQARQSLEKHDYAQASQMASGAARAFSALTLDTQKQRAETTVEMATQGSDALAQLQAAQSHKNSFNIAQAESEAQQAGETLAQLGDAPRVAQANAILSELWLWQRLAGLAALGVGAFCLLVSGLAISRTRRRAMTPPATIQQLREENRSWL